MKSLSAIMFALGAFALAGCGAEQATTAATSAAIKKQEMDAAKKSREVLDKKIDEVAQAMKQRAEQQSNADK